MKMIAYPVGIQPVDDRYFAYIPNFQQGFFAASIGEAMTKSREIIINCLTDLNDDTAGDQDIPEPLTINEAYESILRNTGKVYEEITYVDVDLEYVFPENSVEINVRIPEWMMQEAGNYGIDASNVCVGALMEEIHLRSIREKVIKFLGKDVTLSLDNGTLYGRAVDIIPDRRMANEQILRLDTGKESTLKVNLRNIYDISPARLIFDELGTFHFELTEGHANYTGNVYWDTHTVDVYLDISLGVPLTEMPSVLCLHDIYDNKETIDRTFKDYICNAMRDSSGRIVIPVEDKNDHAGISLDEQAFRNLLELYFINISSKGSLYLDYNIEFNKIGCTFGIHAEADGTVKKLDIRSFTY